MCTDEAEALTSAIILFKFFNPINVSKENIFTGFSLTIGEKSEKKNPNKFSSKVVPVGLDIRTAKGTAFIR